MNIYGAATLFAILILLYYVISEVFTVLFRLILLLEHHGKKPEPPDASSVFESGDRLMVFGGYHEICQAFDAKEYFTGSGDEPDDTAE